MALRVAFAGGGTGGHVVPGLHLLAWPAVRAEIEDLVWFQTGREAERRLLPRLAAVAPASFERIELALEPRGGGAPTRARLALAALPAARRARAALRAHGSQVLLGLGGFPCLPATLAAASLGVPVVLFEINAVGGTATRWLTPLAKRVLHAWSASMPAQDRKHVRTGPPLDPRCFEPLADPGAARRSLGLEADAPLLLVLGGSQGAGSLNTFVRERLDVLQRSGACILHQVGPGRGREGAEPHERYRAVETVDDVPTALRAATAVLCRGGASTLAEVAAARRPAWVVPYPHHADRHQERNARELGAGVRIVAEEGLDLAAAVELARWLGPDGATERGRMEEALAGAVSADAAPAILAQLRDLARERDPG